MWIRDALESDAETLAAAIDRPRDAVVNMIHSRSVRVAVSDDDGGAISDGNTNSASKAASSDGTVEGFVAFDVHGDAVHVTDFDGDRSAIQRLFEEPKRFASQEGLTVEVVIPDDEGSRPSVEAAGFKPVGSGPRFEGRPTTIYRIEPNDLE